MHGRGKALAVDRQRAASRDLMRVGATHDERVDRAHLAMNDADRIVGGVVGAEGIGTDEFRKLVGAMRLGAAHRAHFVQDDRNAALRDLPGSFATGEAAADNMDRFHGAACHKAHRARQPART